MLNKKKVQDLRFKNILEIDILEIRAALKQMKNRQALGEDQIQQIFGKKKDSGC